MIDHVDIDLIGGSAGGRFSMQVSISFDNNTRERYGPRLHQRARISGGGEIRLQKKTENGSIGKCGDSFFQATNRRW